MKKFIKNNPLDSIIYLAVAAIALTVIALVIYFRP